MVDSSSNWSHRSWSNHSGSSSKSRSLVTRVVLAVAPLVEVIKEIVLIVASLYSCVLWIGCFNQSGRWQNMTVRLVLETETCDY